LNTSKSSLFVGGLTISKKSNFPSPFGEKPSGTNTSTLTIANVQLSEHNQPIRVITTSGECVDTSVSMLKERKEAKGDEAKMKAMEEKYKSQEEKCKKVFEKKSDEEMKKLEDEAKKCEGYAEMEKIMKGGM
jgi:hypothetical protein